MFDLTFDKDQSKSMAQGEFDNHEEIYTARVKAGKRTYFFDVKETRNGEYYMTVSELLKKTGRDGQPMTTRHKIFLYKEDFNTFMQEMNNAIGFIRKNKGDDYGSEGRVYEDDWNNENAQRSGSSTPPAADDKDKDTSGSGYSADFKFEDL
jgi:hypothetical protein